MCMREKSEQEKRKVYKCVCVREQRIPRDDELVKSGT